MRLEGFVVKVTPHDPKQAELARHLQGLLQSWVDRAIAEVDEGLRKSWGDVET